MVNEGDRIELIRTEDKFTKLNQRELDGTGAKGTVESVETDPQEITPSGLPEKKIWVDWDNGSKLALIVSQDEFEVLETEQK